MVNLKVIVVGDDACGKTSLIRALRGRQFNGAYSQTTSHASHTFTVQINEEIVKIEIWEISRQEDFTADTDVDVILGCFSIGDRKNYQLVTDICNHAQHEILAQQLMFESYVIPVILIGTKSDMRDEQSTSRHGGQASSSENVQETSFTTGDAEAAASSSDKTKASASQGFEAEPFTSATTDKSFLLPAIETLPPFSSPGPMPLGAINLKHVATSEGRALAGVMKAKGYYECSALTGDGVVELRQVLGSRVIRRECSCQESCSRCVLCCFSSCNCRCNQ